MTRRSRPTSSASTNNHAFARRVAPLAPLALSLIMQPGITGSTAAKKNVPVTGDLQVAICDRVEGSDDCHTRFPTGCTSPGSTYDPFLNLLKNKTDFPAAVAVNFATSLDTFTQLDQQFQSKEKQMGETLNDHNHRDFETVFGQLGEGSLQGAIGYLEYLVVQKKAPGDGETCNCKLGNEDEVDFHIGIGFDPKVAANVRSDPNSITHADKQKSIIVEMTPHFRANFQPGWTPDALNQVMGRKVKVVGQLMADNDHNLKSQNCALPNATNLCWRATIWELHPVTKFQVCMATNNDCDVNSPDWVDLGGASDESGATTPVAPKAKKKKAANT